MKRFSLISLLVLVAVVAGFLAGWDRGWQIGKAEWTSKINEFKDFRVYTKVHWVGQTLSQYYPGKTVEEGLESLMKDIKANVLPQAWIEDPKVTIRKFTPNMSIIVTGNALLQREIEIAILNSKIEWPPTKEPPLEIPEHWLIDEVAK